MKKTGNNQFGSHVEYRIDAGGGVSMRTVCPAFDRDKPTLIALTEEQARQLLMILVEGYPFLRGSIPPERRKADRRGSK